MKPAADFGRNAADSYGIPQTDADRNQFIIVKENGNE